MGELERDILERCRGLGFALAGISDAAPTAYADELRAWLASGRHGEMTYLQKNLEALLDPNRILDGVQSIICVADRYHDGRRDRLPPADQGRIARYARGDDYHKSMKRRLHQLADVLRAEDPEHRFRVCVDTAPLLEREYAARAGLGAIGKHTLLIEQGVGSHLLLGEILTTLPLTPTQPNDDDPCGMCTKCIEACPTDAITPWSVDATRCISYLTIEHRSAIVEEFHEPTGQWIFGCDICQDVCPHNQPTRRSRRAQTYADYAPRRSSLDLADVLNWSEDDRRSVFAGSAMKRAKLNMMKRNALIAAGNALAAEDDAALRQRITQLAADSSEDELVRRTASKVLRRCARANF